MLVRSSQINNQIPSYLRGPANGSSKRSVFSIIQATRRLTDFIDKSQFPSIISGSATAACTNAQGQDSFAAAMNDVAAYGGDVFIDEGVFNQSSPWAHNKPGTIYGHGEGSILRCATAGMQRINQTASDTCIAELVFLNSAGLTRTGPDIYVSPGVQGSLVYRCRAVGSFALVQAGYTPGAPDAQVADLKVDLCQSRTMVPATGQLIILDSGLAINITRNLCDTVGTKPAAGITIKNVGDVHIQNNQLLTVERGLNMDPRTTDNGAVRTVHSSNNFYDHCTYPIYCNGQNAPIVRVTSVEDWMASGYCLAKLFSDGTGGGYIKRFTMSSAECYESATNGVEVSGAGILDFYFDGTVSGCAQAGLAFINGVKHFRTGPMTRSGPVADFSANAYGIYGDNTLDWYAVDGDFTGNVTQNVSMAPSGSSNRRVIAATVLQ